MPSRPGQALIFWFTPAPDPAFYMVSMRKFLTTSWLIRFCLHLLIVSIACGKQGALAEGDVLPELIWTDQKIRQNVPILSLGRQHIVLRVDGQLQSLTHEKFLTLYWTTQKSAQLIRINQLALEIGGGKPGAPSVKRVSPGFIIPKLIWTDGQPKELVEILNSRRGYYVMRVDGKTQVLDKHNFLAVLEKTKVFLENGLHPVPALPPPAGQLQANGNLLPPPPPPALGLPPPAPGKSGLEPPPKAQQGTQPPGPRPVYFDFQFQGEEKGSPPPDPTPAPSQ